MIIAKQIEPFLKNLRGAIHVGANVGEEREWYDRMGFTKVLWFEPNKELFPILESNIEQYPNQKAYNLGIHDTLKHAPLHISNNAGQSSSLLDLGTHAKHHPEVLFVEDQEIELTRLDGFLRSIKEPITDYNFLNIDVQGVELNVLKSLSTLLGKIDYLYLEVNEEEVYKGCALTLDIDDYVRQWNFIRIKTYITKAHWGDAFYIRY